MTRFVEIYHDPKDDPGSRIRLEYAPDDTGAFCICDENVFPEKTFDPDAKRVEQLACVNLDDASAAWLRDKLIALCELRDRERAEANASEVEMRARAHAKVWP